MPDTDVGKYGIIDPRGSEIEPNLMYVASLVEKPLPGTAPSNYPIMGRYLLTREIFAILENQVPGLGGEIQLTDAIRRLNELKAVMAYSFKGIRYDTGDKFGFIKATLDFALQREELRGDVLGYIREIYEGRGRNS